MILFLTIGLGACGDQSAKETDAPGISVAVGQPSPQSALLQLSAGGLGKVGSETPFDSATIAGMIPEITITVPTTLPHRFELRRNDHLVAVMLPNRDRNTVGTIDVFHSSLLEGLGVGIGMMNATIQVTKGTDSLTCGVPPGTPTGEFACFFDPAPTLWYFYRVESWSAPTLPPDSLRLRAPLVRVRWLHQPF